jgi:Polyketide cyclase / dehydrase and lipid transport
MMKKILIGLIVVISVFLVIVAKQPSHFRVERSITVNAPSALVFDHVNDLHKWEQWSPWAKLDPNAKGTFEGPGAGLGASHSWAGNKDVGEGKMTIIESRAGEFVRFRLDFLKPFKATNTSEFTFTSEGTQTAVTWSMEGTNNFIFKAVGLFMDCDKMIGKDFEKGLADLKTVSEAPVGK